MTASLKCDICNKKLQKSNSHARIIGDQRMLLCGKHYSQYVNNNFFLDNSSFSSKDPNRYEIYPEYALVFTTDIKGTITGYFIVDIEDLEQVLNVKWRMWKGRYYTGSKKIVSITSFLIHDRAEGQVVDHRNHKPWDNRRINLRVITQSQNIQNQTVKSTNSSGVAGVWRDNSRGGIWVAEIKHLGVKCFLGRYEKFEDACFARFTAENVVFNKYRNSSNDKILLPIIRKCTNQIFIGAEVMRKIYNRYITADQSY